MSTKLSLARYEFAFAAAAGAIFAAIGQANTGPNGRS
jgi:hypothetical protein